MPWYDVFKRFRNVGSFLRRALTFVETYVTDEQVEIALEWARVAAKQFTSNTARREYVVKILVNRGVPENIARIAVEIAVGLLKAELKAEEDAEGSAF